MLGDKAFRISEMEKVNLRWEAKKFQARQLWHRWDYPNELGSRDLSEYEPVLAMYYTDNCAPSGPGDCRGTRRGSTTSSTSRARA